MRSAHRVPFVNEPTFVEFRQPERQGLIAFKRDNGTMVRLPQREALGFNSACPLDLDNFGPLRRAAMAACISVSKRVLRVIKLLDVEIGNTRIVNGVSPTQILVMADYRKRHAQK
jgi:hypothetical protein